MPIPSLSTLTTYAPSGPLTAARTYCRLKENGGVETFHEAIKRAVYGHQIVHGKQALTDEQVEFIFEQASAYRVFPSGRMLWCGGTPWLLNPSNYSGAYNCTSLSASSLENLATMMNLGMMGCGVGKNLEQRYLDKLPPFTKVIHLTIEGGIGQKDPDDRQEETRLLCSQYDVLPRHPVTIEVGDSRVGWCRAYLLLLELATGKHIPPDVTDIDLRIDLSNIRPKGTRLKGFGGVCDPTDLTPMFSELVEQINKISIEQRRPKPDEVLFLIDRPASTIVAGNIRRFAGIALLDKSLPSLKAGLWTQDENGTWVIDKSRDCFRMSNHTRTYHTIPTLDEVIEAVGLQYRSGEGAVMFVPEALARTNADLLDGDDRRIEFMSLYLDDPEKAFQYLVSLAPDEPTDAVRRRMERYQLNPCFAPGTMIMTREGHFPIESLVGKKVKVFDGQRWVETDSFRITGEDQPILKITLVSGQSVRATPYHEFVLADGTVKTAATLSPGDSLLWHQAAPDNEIAVIRSHLSFDVASIEPDGIEPLVYCCTIPTNHQIALSNGLVTRQCGEIPMKDNHCNLAEVPLNIFDPDDSESIARAFIAGALMTCSLLHHDFSQISAVMQQSREEDPIVATCPTGIFDFFVHKFGIRWLQWWQADRVRPWGNIVERDVTEGDYFYATETQVLTWMKSIVVDTVKQYCKLHGLRVPNRCTAVQPSGTKALITGASPGWHPPKAVWFIRRITCVRDAPVTLAALDVGYNVVPSQSCKDEDGRLLNDPYDPRVQEWLVEIPSKVSWSDLPGVEEIDISKLSALAQFDFMMQVQNSYTEFNTSSTIELEEHEIVPLATAIHENMANYGGYISSALLARFDATSSAFPRLPFEPIDEATYDRLCEERSARAKFPLEMFEERFVYWVAQSGKPEDEVGPAGCDTDKCLMPEVKQ